MFSVAVRDHVMIAHSLSGEVFGPAQRLHGATYAVQVEFRRPALDQDGIVVDIGRASAALKEVLAPLAYRNLDELPELAGENTTTEYLAQHIFTRIAEAIGRGDLGPGAADLSSMKVTLHESPAAWAAYEGTLGAAET